MSSEVLTTRVHNFNQNHIKSSSILTHITMTTRSLFNRILTELLVKTLLLLLASKATLSTSAASIIKDQTFCSTGFAVHVNLDCYPRIVHVLTAEKGVLSKASIAASTCDPANSLTVKNMTSPICKNEASPVCTNAFGLQRGSYVRVRFKCVEHRSVCGGSLSSFRPGDGNYGGVTEMAPPIGDHGVVYSPNYKGENGRIPETADCSLIIKLPPHSHLQLDLKDFHLPQTHSCKTSSLSIYQTKDDIDSGDGPSTKQWLRKWLRCGIWKKGTIYRSGDGVTAVKIVFVTYPHYDKDDQNSRGFVVQYNVTGGKEDETTVPTTKRTTLSIPLSSLPSSSPISSSSSSSSSSKFTPKPIKTTNSSHNEVTSFHNASKITTTPPPIIDPGKQVDDHRNESVITAQDSFGLTEVIICVSAAGGVIVLILGVAALICARKYQKNQVFQRNLNMRYSRSDSNRGGGGGGGSSSLGRDALLQPYYMGAANETDVVNTTLRHHPHHKSLMRPSTALSQYPDIFNGGGGGGGGGDQWAGERTPVTNVTYTTPTYNYQGIPTTEL